MKEKQEYYAKGFENGAGCCQMVLENFEKETGLSKESLQKIGSAFTGGMYEAKTCGCVIGAYIALGLLHGYSTNETEKSPDFLRKKFEFDQKFKEKFGSLECKEILGHDLTTKEGNAAIAEKTLFTTLCPKVLDYTVEIVKE